MIPPGELPAFDKSDVGTYAEWAAMGGVSGWDMGKVFRVRLFFLVILI